MLPVKFRYRSPVVFEFHPVGKRLAAAYAVIWLQHLVDNEPIDIDIPIWTTKMGFRLTQNYITEENVKAKRVPGLEDLQEIGRLQFCAQFKAGTDESHRQFITDNTSRETYETWEACLAEGVRTRTVSEELPGNIAEMHEKSLTDGRDVLEQADPEERKKWLAKDGQDWSGAFGHDPKAYMDSQRRKRAEPGSDKPVHDPHLPSSDDENISDDYDSDSESDLGVKDAEHANSAEGMDGHPGQQGDAPADTNGKLGEEANKRSEKRKHRGLMQWKPMRNAAFAKHEAGFAVKRVKHKLTGGLSGREPGVETET